VLVIIIQWDHTTNTPHTTHPGTHSIDSKNFSAPFVVVTVGALTEVGLGVVWTWCLGVSGRINASRGAESDVQI
jgi:hypothetical protein